jgi:hypothetical protein
MIARLLAFSVFNMMLGIFFDCTSKQLWELSICLLSLRVSVVKVASPHAVRFPHVSCLAHLAPQVLDRKVGILISCTPKQCCDITIIMTTDGPLVLRHVMEELHNESSRACCRLPSC